jgi:3',5'-cyclic AMP phosphodiesterase CpdA
MATGVDLVLCGHDHEERAGILPNGAVVATSGTHTSRTRGKRPSACNVISIDAQSISVRHQVWNTGDRAFFAGPELVFPRPRVAEMQGAGG